MGFLESQLFSWVVLPILIFCARILDVSIGTLRIVFIARNHKVIAPILGFFEVLIWLAAIGQIFKHLSNVACYLAYAGGFALGNYVGMLIENRLAIGQLIVRIITASKAHCLLERLRSAGCSVTLVNGEGPAGPVKILFTVIRRKDLKKVLDVINEFAPGAFYTVEDLQIAGEAILPQLPTNKKRYYRELLKMSRRRK
jgi:uncharacterized protein YebE (UPF0316 family)